MKNSTITRSSKKGLTVGLTAGLIGGTAAGLVFGVPGISGAASDSVAPAALIQQTDETDPPADAPADPTADDTRPEPGVRLRETLQALVDDGTITAAQADAVAEHLVANRPDRGGFDMRHRGGPGGPGGPGGLGGRGGPGRFGPVGGGEASETVTELLGVDADALREQLRSGESLADIATANGVDPQTLVDALVDVAEARVAAAVEDGKIDADRAVEVTADIEQRVTDMVNGVRPDRPSRGPGADVDD